MFLAPNVVAYEPEVELATITPARLRANNWPSTVVQHFEHEQPPANPPVSEQQPSGGAHSGG